jgi:hypothetical protein
MASDDPLRPPGLPPLQPNPGEGMARLAPADTPGAGPPGLPPAGPDIGPPPGTRRVAIWIAVGLIAVGAVVGVLLGRQGRGGLAKAPPATLPSGWTLQDVKTEGFSVGLPPNWTSLPTTSVDQAMKTLQRENPELARLVGPQLGSSLSSLMKLLAFDGTSPTLQRNFATNLNIIVAPAESSTSFEEFVSASEAQLRAVSSVSNVTSERHALPVGPSAIVRSELTLNTGAGSQKAAITQYLVLGRDKAYILSFTTLPDALDTYAPVFEQIAQTFRVT